MLRSHFLLRQRLPICCVRGLIVVQTRVSELAVVPVDVLRNVCLRMTHALVRTQVHPFVLNATPESLDEHVVAPRAAVIHGELRAASEHRARELLSCELTALIGVDDLKTPVRERF